MTDKTNVDDTASPEVSGSETDDQTTMSETTKDSRAPGADASQGSAFLTHREATATGESYRQTDQEIRSRKRRSIVIGLALVAFVVLIYAITMLKLSANI